jgi:phage terminase large subunit
VRDTLRLNEVDAVTALAIDFGFANPFVCLWVRFDGTTAHVIDEYVQPQRTLLVHLQQIQQRHATTVSFIACDPAGEARNEHTADSAVTVLRRAGYRVKCRRSRIVDGLESIRNALRPADGSSPRLVIHPRCVALIAAMGAYRYADPQTDPVSACSELPVKDGVHDHLVDALRYFFVNRTGGALIVSKY